MLFPTLIAVGALRIEAVADLDSLLDSDGFGSNNATDSSFPLLTLVREELTITGCVGLFSISFPQLCSVGTDFTVGGAVGSLRNSNLSILRMCTGSSPFNIAGDTLIENSSSSLSCDQLTPVFCRADGGSKTLKGGQINEACVCP